MDKIITHRNDTGSKPENKNIEKIRILHNFNLCWKNLACYIHNTDVMEKYKENTKKELLCCIVNDSICWFDGIQKLSRKYIDL